MNTIRKNGEIWLDTEGNEIHAHGGHILKVDSVYYWYGEDRRENIYVSCYRSTNLIDWEFCSHSLTTNSKIIPFSNLKEISPYVFGATLLNKEGGKVNLERPKILYNEKTKKYVMWIHFENGIDYHDAACAVATCDRPDGEFTYHGHFRPTAQMSRDCTLYLDNDIAYFISATNDNANMNIYRLSDDYLSIDRFETCLWVSKFREAPSIFKKDDRYYLFSSYCTGWDPNQCQYGFSKSLTSGWSDLYNIGDEVTYRSQPAFILTVENKSNENQYLYVADRWDSEDYFNSSYVILPIEFDKDNNPILNYYNSFIRDDNGTFVFRK